MFDIPCSGTHAHAFVSSFIDLKDLLTTKIKTKDGFEVEFVENVIRNLHKLFPGAKTNEGELAAFISYAQASPSGFLALVDTYDVLNSGIPNFLAVAVTLHLIAGYRPLGIRLDSGDLAYQSKFAREQFQKASKTFDIPIHDMTIVASNDISESALIALNEAGHSIDTFGIGTNLVTCLSQPALGGVYKLVEIEGNPRIKLSAELSKVTIPGRKSAYRLYSKDGPAMDLLQSADSPAPTPGERILCRHPFNNLKRAYIRPSKVEPLFNLVWNGKLVQELPKLAQNREYCMAQLSQLREDHKRVVNPTPYKVSVSEELFKYMHELWENECPIHEIE
jgi:nicotinate phosphoribosyltransferase